MDSPSAGYTFEYLIETLSGSSHKKFFNVPKLGGTKYDILPYSIRVLLEAAVRNCDGFLMKREDVMNILDWKTKQSNVEVPFFPARVVLQDFTGIPAMVDFAAMREAVKSLGGDPEKVHPACPTDLTVDHSLQIDFSKCAIQNAPNPGGGDVQKAGKLSPLKVQPKKLPCRGQSTCRGACDSGELSRNSGTFSSQIENTPILCPFHLQPVPEYDIVCVNVFSAGLQNPFLMSDFCCIVLTIYVVLFCSQASLELWAFFLSLNGCHHPACYDVAEGFFVVVVALCLVTRAGKMTV